MFNAPIRSDTHLYIPRERFRKILYTIKVTPSIKGIPENSFANEYSKSCPYRYFSANTSRMCGYKIFIIIIKQIKKV